MRVRKTGVRHVFKKTLRIAFTWPKKHPNFPLRGPRLEFRGAGPEGALLFLIPHGNGTLFHFFSHIKGTIINIQIMGSH